MDLVSGLGEASSVGAAPEQLEISEPRRLIRVRRASARPTATPLVGSDAYVFCDGSVRFLRNSIDPHVFAALSTRSESETISADQF